jgi:formylglycine-generating enzyme required for sulfatase activity
MSEHFDPYFEWLAIPPEEQPPNHYRLLAVPLFLDNPRVIDHAAAQRMAHLRTLQTGTHSALSRRLLNEVAAARVCLLNPGKKAAYDAKLGATLTHPASSAADTEQRLSQDMAELVTAANAVPRRTEGTAVASASAKSRSLVILGAVGALGVLLVLLVWLMVRGSSTPSEARVAAVKIPAASTENGDLTGDKAITQSADGKPAVAVSPAAPIMEKSGAPPLPSQPRAQEKAPEAVKPMAAKAMPEPTHEKPSPRPATELLNAATREPKPEPPKPDVPSSSAMPAATPAAPPAQQPGEPNSATAPARAAAQEKRAPVPDESALSDARRAADALFKAEIERAKTSADKIALARRLFAQAIEQPGTADRYVLMLTARDLAVTAKDADAAFQYVDQMAQAFEVDRLSVKTDILTGWAKETRTPEARKWIVEQMLRVGDEAIESGNLDAAQELGRLVTAKSVGMRDREIAQKTKVYRQRCIEASKDIEELKAAHATLARDSNDAQANLVVGRHLCFTKGDWQKGLPMLALGSDAALKGLANQELTSPPSQPDAQVALADAWWEIAQARGRSQMDSIRSHAGLWYRKARPGLPLGLVKNKVEQRLHEVTKLRGQMPTPPLAIAPFDERRAKQHQERWAEYLGEPVEMSNSIGMQFVLIPPGEFMMGSAPEEIAWATEEVTRTNDTRPLKLVASEAPRHGVRISKPFYLGACEVTQAEYQRVMGNNPSDFSANGREAAKMAGQDMSRHPVDRVTWDDAARFCQKLSVMPIERAARWVYRLPTEAEWEYACRAGSATKWSFGDDAAMLNEYAWFRAKGSSGLVTHPVGSKRPNAWSLYDMYGNLREWCMDWHAKEFYKQAPKVNPAGPSLGVDRVVRGGGWRDFAGSCRSAVREYSGPKEQSSLIGFRVARVPTE